MTSVDRDSDQASGVTAAGAAVIASSGLCLSTFAKSAELEHMLRVGDVSLLIVERSVLDRDFVADVLELSPELANDAPSTRLPFLRRVVCIGGDVSHQKVGVKRRCK